MSWDPIIMRNQRLPCLIPEGTVKKKMSEVWIRGCSGTSGLDCPVGERWNLEIKTWNSLI